MAIYYVKSGGTATGDAGRATTARTGSFATMGASAYYDNINAAVSTPTTAPSSGDFIYVSSSHSHDYATSNLNLTIPDNVVVISVNDSNADQYLRGAAEASSDIFISDGLTNRNMAFVGIDFTIDDDFEPAGAPESSAFFYDCGITLNNSAASLMSLLSDGVYAVFNNCTITRHVSSATSSGLVIQAGAKFLFINCTFVNGTVLIASTNGSGGSELECRSCDFSGMQTANDPWNLIGAASADDRVVIKLDGCTLPPSTVNMVETLGCQSIEVSLMRCTNFQGTDDPDAYWYFYYQTYYGVVQSDAGTYLNATYDGTNGFSVVMETTATTGLSRPILHKLVEIPAVDLTTSKTVTVEFVTTDATTPATLNDAEFWIDATYNDATDIAQRNTVSGRATDLLTGSAHTTSTESWTGLLASSNKYKQSVTIPAVTGVTNGTIEVFAYLAKASTDVYVDPAVTIT